MLLREQKPWSPEMGSKNHALPRIGSMSHAPPGARTMVHRNREQKSWFPGVQDSKKSWILTDGDP